MYLGVGYEVCIPSSEIQGNIFEVNVAGDEGGGGGGGGVCVCVCVFVCVFMHDAALYTCIVL